MSRYSYGELDIHNWSRPYKELYTNEQKALSSWHERCEVVIPEVWSIKNEVHNAWKETDKILGKYAVDQAQ